MTSYCLEDNNVLISNLRTRIVLNNFHQLNLPQLLVKRFMELMVEHTIGWVIPVAYKNRSMLKILLLSKFCNRWKFCQPTMDYILAIWFEYFLIYSFLRWGWPHSCLPSGKSLKCVFPSTLGILLFGFFMFLLFLFYLCLNVLEFLIFLFMVLDPESQGRVTK